MEKKLDVYAEHFGENFPLFLVRNLDEKEIIKIIDDCIENDAPYQPEIEDDADY